MSNAFASSSATQLKKEEGIVIHTSCGTTFTIPKSTIENAEEAIELAKAIDKLDCGTEKEAVQ